MTYTSFEEILEKEGVLIYTNKGDSMMPLLREGKDLMVIKPHPEGRLKQWDVPLYKRDTGQYVLHRIVKVRENDYVICGDNRWNLEYGITDRHIIGILTAVIRDGRTIEVDSPEYQAYVKRVCGHLQRRRLRMWFRDLPYRIRYKLARIYHKLTGR